MHAFWFAFVLWSVLFLLMSFLRNSATLDSHFLFFFKKFQTLAGFGEFLNPGLDCKPRKGTLFHLKRLVTFPALERCVEEWVKSCWVCLRFRQQTTKIRAGFVTPRYRLPFHHVMIDCEGRITPSDIDGSAYVLTYVCVTTGAPLFEGMASVRHADPRRAVLKCVRRAKTWPMLVEHGRAS